MSGLTGVRHADPCTCERCCRKAAFGAIRRAAACARYHDYLMEDQSKLFGDGDSVAMRHRAQAIAIRSAIRAAIGSEKV